VISVIISANFFVAIVFLQWVCQMYFFLRNAKRYHSNPWQQIAPKQFISASQGNLVVPNPDLLGKSFLLELYVVKINSVDDARSDHLL
jgi:hypothetical protein